MTFRITRDVVAIGRHDMFMLIT